MAVNLNDPRRADARGWGPGWPNSQPSKMVGLNVSGVSFPGGIREEIHDLMVILLTESEQRGYIELHPGWCWGYADRAIKTSTGGTTNVPSNHSWGLAGDINAPVNGFGASSHTIPAAMARLWNQYGFRWGGDYSGTKDWMHFEFMGTPADARAMTEKARKELEDVALTDDQKDALQFVIGTRMFLDGKKEPQDTGPRRQGFRFAQRIDRIESELPPPSPTE